MLKIEEMNLNDGDAFKLNYLLETYNKSLPESKQLSIQQYAEQLLIDAIYFKYKMMKSL